MVKPMSGDAVFALTDSERRQVDDLSGVLAERSPQLIDDPAWVSFGRLLSCQLPARLSVRLREFRHDPGSEGSLLIRGLPVDEKALPPTPIRPESVERKATRMAAVIALISLHLGEIISYRNEKAGALVQNVVPVPGYERHQSNAGSTPLEMHVENAFHPNRPDFVALLCLRHDPEGQAGLQVASVRQAVATLSNETRKTLGEARFVTESPPSFGALDTAVPPHPVLDGDFDDPDVRVDFNSTHPLDDAARDAWCALRDALVSVLRTVRLGRGDLAILDNRVALHGRTYFEPRYDGTDRWLHRTFVHLDHRRTRPLRSATGHVLS
jgi:L-asparagine oxygenase